MFKKLLPVLALLVSTTFAAEMLNIQGWNDTCRVTGFKSTNTCYSKAFSLSQYETIVLDVLVNDTTAAGFAADTVKFIWYTQTGHLVINSSNVVDTFWSQNLGTVDTFDMVTSPTYTRTYHVNGISTQPTHQIDTTSITGYAVQSHPFFDQWDALLRFVHVGVSGNNTHSNLKVIDNISQRAYIRTRSN